MKLYKFYKSPSDEVLDSAQDLSIEDKYPLYAFTNNKKFARRFIDERNMNKFIKRVTDITKDEYVEFSNKYRGSMLEIYRYSAFVGYSEGVVKIKKKDVELLTTWQEKEITSMTADDGIASISDSPKYNFFPFVFEKKYVKALEKLEYITHWKYLGSPDLYKDFIQPDEVEHFMDFSSPYVSIDEFSLYIALFGNTYKG